MSSGLTPDAAIIDHAQSFQKKVDQYIVIELVEAESSGQKKRAKEYVWKDVTDKEKSSRLVGDRSHEQLDGGMVKPNFEEFVEIYFKPDRALFAYYDFSVVKPLNQTKAYKIGAFKWCPDTLPVGKKMVFGSSLEQLKKQCNVSAHMLPGTDPEDLVFENVIKEMEGK